jgi:hypothetical protein
VAANRALWQMLDYYLQTGREVVRSIRRYSFMIGNKPKGGFLYYVTCILMHQSSTNSIHLREFFSLKNLREVTLCNSYIETKVCSDYKPLEQILIPSTLQMIGVRTFKDCSQLRVVGLNKSLVQIMNKAFQKCVSLEYIILPSTIQIIGNDTFHDCNVDQH